MVTPLVLVVLFSFNQSALTSLPLTGLTLDWYRKLFANDSFWPALQNSLIVGFTVAVVSVVTGTLAALALARMRRAPRGRDRSALLSVPMMMPALIIGIALLCYFVRLLDLPLGLGTVILGHLVIAQPFVILIVYARLATFDWAVVESARDLGASPLTRVPHRHAADHPADHRRRGADRALDLARRFRHHLLHHRRRQHACRRWSGAWCAPRSTRPSTPWRRC